MDFECRGVLVRRGLKSGRPKGSYFRWSDLEVSSDFALSEIHKGADQLGNGHQCDALR